MNEKHKESEVQVGERIRNLREDLGLSLKEMEARCGISSSLISQIENHLISPPLGTLIKLSKALGVEVGYFFDEKPTAPFTIVRKNERRPVSRFASKEGVRYGYSYESLGFDKKDRHMEPFLVTLEPTTLKDTKLSSHDGEEFIFVLEGRMEVFLGDHKDLLEEGDCIYYDANIPHRVQCMEDKEARILAVIYSG